MNKLILTKESSTEQIKLYFQKVLELKQSNEDFPINLDEVWMLVYAEKGTAIRALKKNFIDNEDFISLDQNVKRAIGGTITTVYKLSISCLEYFIARKVRSVFDVYRQVFHKSIIQKPLSELEILQKNVTILIEQEKKIKEHDSRILQLEAKQQTIPDYFTIAGYGTLNGITLNMRQASTLGQRASRLCKQRNIPTDTTPDARYGVVNMYPRKILDEVFAQPIN